MGMLDHAVNRAGVWSANSPPPLLPMISLRLRILSLSAILLLTACGQEETVPSPPANQPDKTALRQALFEPLEPAAFQKAIEAARAGGVSEQAIVEARFLTLIDLGDYPGIAKLVPELETLNASFDIKNSAIFATSEEWLSVIQYTKALAALEAKDETAFKKHITEAFWLSPRQAAIFAPHIDRLRLKAAMAKVHLDFQRTFKNEETGLPASLQSVAGDSGHVLLHFWSPWSRECADNLPDFIATSRELANHNIAVASILAEPDPEALPDAKSFRADIPDKVAGAWLLDDIDSPTAQLLRVQVLPTFVLADTNGTILFNGHPSDPELWSTLQRVAPNITRPPVQPEEILPSAPPAE